MAQDLITESTKIVTTKLVRPNTLVALFIAFLVVQTAGPNLTEGVVGQLLTNYGNNTIGNLIRKYPSQIIAASYFAPTVFSLPESTRMASSLVVGTWVSSMPKFTAMEYMVQSLMLLLFFSLKQKYAKILILGFVALYWFGGDLGFNQPGRR